MDHDNCSSEVYDLIDGNRAKLRDLLCQRVYDGGDEVAEKTKSLLRLHEEWFAERDQIRDAVSLDDTPFAVVPGDRDDEVVACSICVEAKPAAHIASAGCAYRYCRRCGRSYVAAALDGGGARAPAPCYAGWWSGSPRAPEGTRTRRWLSPAKPLSLAGRKEDPWRSRQRAQRGHAGAERSGAGRRP
ncbi:putative E3 ubiquitin-protein ligase ARI5 [Panicum miliaceum]|uniref:E3 ubiquitin-protein ligase ARI5 n=1 Tax=Panicum miliaceum TaxID=4540 RepID=A0A3L6PMS1_PANMI|nr:putative E3 ubiquitin-protein ligase ARI5 [Panicum miliaceum]